MRTIRRGVAHLFVIVNLIIFNPAWAALEPVFQDIGKVSISVDAEGNNDAAGGTIRVNKPAGATVRKAFLMANSHGVEGDRVIADGDVSLTGEPVTWDRAVFNGVGGRPQFFHNVFADVTATVAAIIDAAPPGITEIPVTEVATFSINGTVLV
ncbi:MAG: hypothetical protein ACRDGA_12795, partial [Bacteroidota bacterium]